MTHVVDIDSYLSAFPAETRARLERIRALVHGAAPGAVESISYGIPTFDLNGKHLVHFGGYAHHIGMYPVPVDASDLNEEFKRYMSGRGTARFPLDEPLPEELVLWIVERQLRRLGAET